jgi:ATP synthase F1 complex assembly factor 2
LFYFLDGYQVTIDNSKVKTPHRNLLVVPNKQLAMAIAAEWNMQKDVIKPTNMNLVIMCVINTLYFFDLC